MHYQTGGQSQTIVVVWLNYGNHIVDFDSATTFQKEMRKEHVYEYVKRMANIYWIPNHRTKTNRTCMQPLHVHETLCGLHGTIVKSNLRGKMLHNVAMATLR